MRLIFIRHGEPDYSIDSLTANGRREADALAKRVAGWDHISEILCSPLGRAIDTSRPSLEVLGREAVIYPWLREFSPTIQDPLTGESHGCWDLMPQTAFGDPMLMDPNEWYKADIYKPYPEIGPAFRSVCDGLDEVLARHGYTRENDIYHFHEISGEDIPAEKEDLMLHGIGNYVPRDEDDEENILIFCHFGVTCVMLSHLLNISPVALWHGLCVPPTGITIVNAEKRLHNACYFRTQAVGDVAHLLQEGLPVSGYAAFSTVFQK